MKGMRIEAMSPLSYIQNAAPLNNNILPASAPFVAGQPDNSPDVVLDISPAGRGLSGQSGAGGIEKTVGVKECQTCKNRKYQDVSNDPSVSFQTPTKIGPGQAAFAVAAHEAEHVASDRASATREGREIISQTVSLKTAICPECGIIYISGGVTRTISKAKVDMKV